MATNHSSVGKHTKSAEPKRGAAPTAPEETTVAIDAAEAPVASAPEEKTPVVEAPVVETVSEAPTSVVVAVQASAPAVLESVVSQEFSADIAFDATLWSKKVFELWSQSAQAFLDHAEQIAKAESFEEVVSLQSRFAGAQFEAFLRQSQEVMALAQRMASVSAAPLCGARAA